jgi:hypothetical protein
MASTPKGRDSALVANGTRLLIAGGVMIAIGIALVLLLDGLGDGIGVAVGALGAVPALGGLGMLFAGLVERRSRAGKPFA